MGQIDKISNLLQTKLLLINYTHKIEDLLINIPNNKKPLNIDCKAFR